MKRCLVCDVLLPENTESTRCAECQNLFDALMNDHTPDGKSREQEEAEMEEEIEEEGPPFGVTNLRQLLRFQAAGLFFASMANLGILLAVDNEQAVQIFRSNMGAVALFFILALASEILSLGIAHRHEWARILSIASSPFWMLIFYLMVIGGILGILWILAWIFILVKINQEQEKQWFKQPEEIDISEHLLHFTTMSIIAVVGFVLGLLVTRDPGLLSIFEQLHSYGG